MTIVRLTVGFAVFALVLGAFRWGANALVRQAIRQSQEKTNIWGDASHANGANVPRGFDFGPQRFDMQKFNEGYLYRPNETGPGNQHRGR